MYIVRRQKSKFYPLYFTKILLRSLIAKLVTNMEIKKIYCKEDGK